MINDISELPADDQISVKSMIEKYRLDSNKWREFEELMQIMRFTPAAIKAIDDDIEERRG